MLHFTKYLLEVVATAFRGSCIIYNQMLKQFIIFTFSVVDSMQVSYSRHFKKRDKNLCLFLIEISLHVFLILVNKLQKSSIFILAM